jgi:FkbM family methyltransferase
MATPRGGKLGSAFRLGRRLVKPAALGILNSRLAGGLALALFRQRASRAVLNRIYQRFGPRLVGGRIHGVLSRGAVKTDFVWLCRMAGRRVLLPVSPALPGSWWAAISWTSNGMLGLRAFYEFYATQKTHGILFDVGANCGVHSYPFAARGYRCVAFEPQRVCAEYIRRVATLNSFSHFEVEEYAVGEDRPDLEFFVSDATGYSSFSRSLVERFEVARSIHVDSVSLDTYCRTHQITPTIMKVDVEGWEWHVLSGGERMITESRPTLAIEVLPWASHKRALWDWCDSFGYLVFAVCARPLRPLRSMHSSTDFMAATEADYVLVADRDLAERCTESLVGL